MNQLSKNLRNLGILFCAVIFSFVIGFIVLADWTGPETNPPGGNVDLPINVGESLQEKLGSLGLGGLVVNKSAHLATQGGNVGIGTSSPTEKLHVEGNIRTDFIKGSRWQMRFDHSDYIYMRDGTETSTIRFYPNTGDIKATAFYYSSDVRLKENIKSLENSLPKVLKLNGISYNLKENGEKSLGFSAQEVREIFPEAVSEDNEGMLSINSSSLIAPLVEAVKEQNARIDTLEKELELLKK